LAGAKEKTKDGKLPLHYACDCQAPVEVVRALLERTLQSLHFEASDLRLTSDQVVFIFKAICRHSSVMKSLTFRCSLNCHEVVNSVEWAQSGLPAVPASRDQNWLQLAKTLAELGKFGSERNDFSRIMFIGRGMAGKSRLAKALTSSKHKSSAIDPDDRSIGSDLSHLQLTAADGRHIDVAIQDCAGQRVAYISHCVHVIDDCLYVLVWSPFKEGYNNVFASIKEICDPLFVWLGILASHAPHAHIVLVGTHLDTPAERAEPGFFPKWFLGDYPKRYAALAAQVEAFVLGEVMRLNELTSNERQTLVAKLVETCDLVAQLHGSCSASNQARVHDMMDQQVWQVLACDKSIPRRDRVLAQRIVCSLNNFNIMRRKLDILEGKHGDSAAGIVIHYTAHVDSASGTNVEELRGNLGAVVGDLSFVKKEVPKRWKLIRHKLPALAERPPHLPVFCKAQVIAALRNLDVVLGAMTEEELWDGVMFWAGLGVVLERNGQLFHDTTQVLELIKPLVHPLPTALLSQKYDSCNLLLQSSKTLGPNYSVAVPLLTDLETKLELSVELLDHFTAWSRMNAAQREAMLSFLLDSSLLCPLRDRTCTFMVTMRLSKDDASSISPEYTSKAAHAPHNAAYLLPVRFIALVPKLMSAMVSLQPIRVKVNVLQCRDEGIVLTRGDSYLVLQIIDMAAARVHTTLKQLPTISLPDSGKFDCVVHVTGNDLGLLHIAAVCFEHVSSSGKLGCRRQCWCLHPDTRTWIQFEFENERAVARSLVDAIREHGCAVIYAPLQLRFCDLFPEPRRRVFVVSAGGDGCGEFMRRLQAHIEQLSFTSVGCSMCEAGSLDFIRTGIMDSGVIVICITPQFFLNKRCTQALQWALELQQQQLRHVAILPLHPAVTMQHRQVIVNSNLLFAGGRAWHLKKSVLELLSSLTAFDDPVPSYTELRPWMSDEQGDNWEERTSPQPPANPISLLTSGFDQAGLVNRMIFDSTNRFVDAVVRHSGCALSEAIFSSKNEPYAEIVDHNYVPDDSLDVAVYPEIALMQFQELLGNMATVPDDQRRKNLAGIHISVGAPGNEPAFSGIPIISPAQAAFSGCNTPGKVRKDGEFYFKKSLNLFVKPCHRFISIHCSKICFRDNCLRVHAVCKYPKDMFMLQPWMEHSNRLDQVMSRQPHLSLPERIRIIRRIASAVRAYHVNGLTHGHVCPSKIFLDNQNAPQLCFPGSEPCNLAGKLRWSSPECVSGTAVSESSDVWSLGVIAYALLLNKIPFDSMTEADIRDAFAPAAASWPPFQVVAPFPVGLPDALPALLQRCWHRDAAMRISVTELACELAALDQTPLSEPLPIPAPDAGYESLSMFQLIRPALPPDTVVEIGTDRFRADDALINLFVAEADSKCRSSQEILLLMTQRSVTLIEAQSIFIYTSELMYKDFTAAFRSQDAARIQRWSNFALTLQSGLRKLEAPPPTFPKRPAVPEFTVV
jgi:serine/threonine protein kinase